MGFLTGGPYYDMIGRTGNNVGRRRKGKNVFSMRPHKSNKAPTEAQQIVRTKFAVLMIWLGEITGLIEVGFQEHPQADSAMNAAFAYNYKKAITGVAPNFSIDYPKFQYSQGKLSPALNPDVEATVAATLKFNWGAQPESNLRHATDMATFMVYNPAQGKFEVLDHAALRSALTYSLTVPIDFGGEQVHCWMSFVSADGKIVSDSQYVAAIVVI